jgi:hypothetical protein
VTVRLADVVNWHDLREAVGLSLVAGIGLSVAYGLVLLGLIRARERYDNGDLVMAALYGLLGLVSLTVTLGGIAVGLIFLIDD